MTRKNNAPRGYELSPRQDRVLELLTAGTSQAEAARQTGAEPATVNRWTRNPLFRSELARRRAEALESIRSELSSTVKVALAAVRDGLADEEVAGAVRLQVASSFLGKILPGLLRIETEAPDIGEVLKAEASRRQDRLLSGALDGTDDILDEARTELEQDG